MKARSLIIALTLLALTPAAAAARAPGVATGGTSGVTASSAQLKGTVNPNGEVTTYWFEYGRNRRYGARTPDRRLGAATKGVKVGAAVGGLSPGVTYHFRLNATNGSGTSRGADRTFRTPVVRLAVTLAPNPSRVTFGSGTILGGRVTGTGRANRKVVLEQQPFPFKAGFRRVGSTVSSDAAGFFRFPLLVPQLTTRFRVKTAGATSRIAAVRVALRVKTAVSATRVHRGARVLFAGTVWPAADGARYAVQRRRSGRWVTLAGGLTGPGSPQFSRYAKRVRITRPGAYRVFVSAINGGALSAVGRTKLIRVV